MGTRNGAFESTAMELDGAIKVIADEQRRRVLYYLRDEGVATVDDLVRHLADDLATPSEESHVDRREHLRTRLLHVHLPHLVAADVIQWDRRSEAVRYEAPSDVLSLLVRLCARYERE